MKSVRLLCLLFKQTVGHTGVCHYCLCPPPPHQRQDTLYVEMFQWMFGVYGMLVYNHHYVIVIFIWYSSMLLMLSNIGLLYTEFMLPFVSLLQYLELYGDILHSVCVAIYFIHPLL